MGAACAILNHMITHLQEEYFPFLNEKIKISVEWKQEWNFNVNIFSRGDSKPGFINRTEVYYDVFSQSNMDKDFEMFAMRTVIVPN